MPKFFVKAELQLVETLGPDGHFRFHGDELEDFSSEFEQREQDIRVPAVVSFVIRADNEDDATDNAMMQIAQDLYFSDHLGLEWDLDDIEIVELEELEPEMDMAQAIGFLRTRLNHSPMEHDERVVLQFLYDHLTARGLQFLHDQVPA